MSVLCHSHTFVAGHYWVLGHSQRYYIGHYFITFKESITLICVKYSTSIQYTDSGHEFENAYCSHVLNASYVWWKYINVVNSVQHLLVAHKLNQFKSW